MKRSLLFLFFPFFMYSCVPREQDSLVGVNDLGSLYRITDAQSRSISPENFTGEKGRGGMATLEEGTARGPARELGRGWKVNPFINLAPHDTFTLADIEGPGIIRHIWMTPTGVYRLMILRIYWDDEETPSVEVPVGDFFVTGWGQDNEPQVSSLAVCVNPRSGFNSYWQMPFRRRCRITMENKADTPARLYYQIDYQLTQVPRDAAYFHAQFRRTNPLPYKQPYTIVDGIRGKGQYVGTFLAHGAFSKWWWGEGEIKFYIDGDEAFPTICGTGEEDYFCGSYAYEMRDGGGPDGRDVYTEFTTPYSGFYYVRGAFGRYRNRVGEYRWHITDPIRFDHDLRVTIQALGWKEGGLYKALEDDMASVAYWYQLEPHHPFPPLPSVEQLVIRPE